MNLDEFEEARISGRDVLLNKIVEIFGELSPVAIYQFGSGAVSYKDEFSDLDIWVVFPDDKIRNITSNQDQIFEKIAPVLVKHESKSWSPPRGSATQIIYKTKIGLFQVDFYISRLSNTKFIPLSKILYGRDIFKKKYFVFHRDLKESQTLKKDINLLLCLIFTSVKGIVREWKSHEFEQAMKIVHKRLRNNYGRQIKRRKIKLSFKLIYRLLNDLQRFSDRSQKDAISEIGYYAKSVENLYKG